ncbi:hypothetical protein MMC31_008209 [Peltigera leucophlebia]|nr:hypothetical protein [Peltigera leucophlebia]
MQDMQNSMNWNSEDPNLHSKSADLSYLPLNHFPAVSLQDIQQWDMTGEPKKPTEARPGFISEISADAVRETAGKPIPHVNPTQWQLPNQSFLSTGSPDRPASKHPKYPKYPKPTVGTHSYGADPNNGSTSLSSSDTLLTPEVSHPIQAKEKPTRYRKVDGISRSPVMKNFAVPPRNGISAQRSISSSPLSSPFVKQSSLWPRTQEFLREVERFDSQPLKQPTWDQMNLQKFYYPKFNSDVPPFGNRKSVSPSSTATPLSNSSSYKHSGPHVGKALSGEYVFMDFHYITHQNPKIPRAIPAPYSFNDGRGTLDRILDNPHSTTNVYIRGFHPNTTDAMIQQYGSRFGEIETAKSIIDHLTNTCKGYGFIKYYNFVDAENCIRGFYYRGYEAKFAKLGHNARLKTLGSPDNTNLYVSNLPRKMNDAELAELFQYVNPDFEVLSQKILRDSQGISRGVGFARFKTPQVCEKVIECFHGKKISNGTDFSILQLRYADTNQQKMLKMETAHRRMFKANEYNTVVYGPGSPYYFESPLSSISMSSIRSYPGNQLPSLSPNSHSFYPSPKSPGDGNPNSPYYFQSNTSLQDSDLHSLGKSSPVDQNGASWMRIETPERKKNFSVNNGGNFPNRSAAIGHSDDVFSN